VGAPYLAGFISPLAVGGISQSSFGLRNTLALFSIIELDYDFHVYAVNDNRERGRF
jgi:hypothetical protein